MCRYLHMAIWSRCTIRVAIAAIYGGVMELSTVVQQKEKSLMRTIEESALVGTRKKPPSIQERKKKLRQNVLYFIRQAIPVPIFLVLFC